MVELGQLALHLAPFALNSVVHALGKAAEGSTPSPATSMAIEVVSGLINDSVRKAAAHFHKDEKHWSSVNTDLDRVVTQALLTILYETLSSNGHASRAADIVRKAENAWQLRIFSASDLTQDQLINLLRIPASIGSQDANEIAGQMLASVNQQGIQAAYATAVERYFAQTFEVLLRQDERAFRAATILLSRKSFFDLAAIRGDLAALAEMLRKQPQLRRFEGQQKNTTEIQSTDFQFKRRATTYRVREEKEAALMQWLLSPQPFGIVKLTGAAGMGKSRLALRICDWCHDEHWLAGFLDAGETLDWNSWTPLVDTLIVVDYVSSKSIGNQSAFRWFYSLFDRSGSAKQGANAPSSRVRVILIDRTDKGTFWIDWSQSELSSDLNQLVLPIHLDPDRAEFDAIVQSELQRRLARDPVPAEQKAIQTLATRLRGQFRPLFALLAAAAIANPEIPSSQAWSPELLVESVLNAQMNQWRLANITDEHLDLLFEATLTQGACCQRSEFLTRLQQLPPDVMHALRSLSDSSFRLGPVVPDLMGEFFVLMRMNGKATTVTRQTEDIETKSNEILQAAWELDSTSDFAALLLEDYLNWKPAGGRNPAEEIGFQALVRLQAGNDSWGLRSCCFLIAWKRPNFCDWLAWTRSLSDAMRGESLRALCIGLYNATTVELNAAQRLAIAERIEALHLKFGQEPVVREQLAKALTNATAVELDAAHCLAIAGRIEALHRDFGQEPAVREQLANALYNATVREPEAAQCLAIAERIEALHREFGQEPVVREQLAKALYNATFGEPEAAQCFAIAERIEALHRNFGQEPVVRVLLASALYNATVGEPEAAQCLAIAERIEALHLKFGQEPAVREALAKALGIAAVKEPDTAQTLAIAKRIEALDSDVGKLPAVRDWLNTILS